MSKLNTSPSKNVSKRRDYDGPVFFKQGFRPFFLAAGVWSALAMAIWLSFLTFGEPASLFGYFSAHEWHIHEMLYGFMSAAVAGFLLTAIPNWTGRLPVRGIQLSILSALWLAGRLAILLSGVVPENFHPIIAVIDSLFLLSFTALLAREIIAGENWKNMPIVAIVALFATANILFHMVVLDQISMLTTSQIGLAVILLAVLLVTLIGGRIVPSFTRNWMVRNKMEPLPAPREKIDQAGAVLITVSCFLLLFFPQSILTGALCILTAIVHMWRLARWRMFSTLGEPLVLILHVGYSWIGIGFLLAGLSIFNSQVPLIAAIHAFSAGMFGSMILAVMTRASRGHTGRPLEANYSTIAIYVLVVLSAIIRVASAIFGYVEWGYLLSGLAWIGAFSLFTIFYLPLFIKR